MQPNRIDFDSMPQMEVTDETTWSRYKTENQDFYGRGIIVFAERWARLMQAEIATGKQLEEVANAAERDADIEGITGFMYGAAVHILAQCWMYGDQLRKWHNRNYGADDSVEGVTNPAIINVSES